MGKASIGSKPVKKKRSDYHFTAEDGSLWDSRFEYVFYTAAKAAGIGIFRCTKSNTFSFILPIRGGICGSCESTLVGQRRSYTPDFAVVSPDPQYKDELHYIETKGYLRNKERSLLRAFYKAHEDTRLSIILQRTYPVGTKRADGTKGSVVDWFKKFLPKVNVHVWTGKIPKGLVGQQARADGSAPAKRLRRANRKADKGATASAE
jgi:hypothetical protein